MIAAIYARKSTEQNVSDDAKSVTRQVALARAFAESHGWTVSDTHVFVDDGISGAEFLDRPAFNRLCASVQTRPRPFDTLVTMDVDRIGREQYQLASELLKIVEAGVRVFFYATGEELKLDTPISKITLSLKGFAAEDYRHQIQMKTREALVAKVRQGYVAGGSCYGYTNRRDGSHVVREIHEQEAVVVRRIFQMAADGKGLQKIAKALTAEGAPGPRGPRWSLSGIREILHRDGYRGRLTYGKSKWIDRGGTKKKVDVPESEWITTAADHLRIVPESLWQAAHDRMARTYEVYLRQNNGRLHGKPESGLESNYLLSGFLKCGLCDGNLVAIRRSGKQRRTRLVYLCNAHRSGACSNKHELGLNEITEAVLGHFKKEFLNPAALGNLLIREWQERAEEPERIAGERKKVESSLQGIETKLQKLVEAITAGGEAKTLVEAIKRLEQERADLRGKLEHLDGLEKAREEFDLASWLEETKEVLADLTATLEGAPQAGRQVLRRLLDGPVTVTPRTDEAGRLYFEYQGSGRFDSALEQFAKAEAGSVKSAPIKRILTGRVENNNVRVRPGD